MPTTGIFDDDDDEDQESDDLGSWRRPPQPSVTSSSSASAVSGSYAAAAAAACPSARFCSQLLFGPLLVGSVWLAWNTLIHFVFFNAQHPQVLRGIVSESEISHHPLFSASTSDVDTAQTTPGEEQQQQQQHELQQEGHQEEHQHQQEDSHQHQNNWHESGEEGGEEGGAAHQAARLSQLLEDEAAASIAQGGEGAILVRILGLLELDCGPPPCNIYASAILQQKSRRTEVLQPKGEGGEGGGATMDFRWPHPQTFLFGVPQPPKPGAKQHFVLEVWKTGLFRDEKIGSLALAIDSLAFKVDEVHTLQMRGAQAQPGSFVLQIAYASAATSPTLANTASATLKGATGAQAPSSSSNGQAAVPCKSHRAHVEFCQTNITDFHVPRYSLTNASQVLWSGDDRMPTTARLSFYTPMRERNKKGVVVQAAKSDPDCDRICSTVGCWRLNSNAVGRQGNRMSELMHAVYLLNRTSILPGLNISPGFFSLVFEFPEHLCIGSPERWNRTEPVQPEKVKGCTEKHAFGHEYEALCKFAKNSEYQPLARSYFLPYLSPSMKGCVEKPRELDEDRLLTIHFRGEDVFGVHIRTKDYERENFWGISVLDRIRLQPPCVFYEKIISEGDFERILLVTSQDLANPCVAWLNDRRQTLRNQRGELLSWELQTGTLEEDSCALMKARHIAPSQSSLSHSLVAVAAAIEPKTVYLAGRPFDKNWILHCDSANVTFIAYDVPYYNPKAMGDLMDPVTKLRVPPTVNATLDWLVNLPSWSVNRTSCEYIDRQHR